MKYLRTYESFINESTTDGTIESLIDVTKISMQMGIFDDEILSDVKDNFIRGIEGALKGQTNKLDQQQKREFKAYSDALMGPLKKAKTMDQFVRAMSSIAAAKDNILNRMELANSLDESKIIDWIKKAKTSTVEWWQENKGKILLSIIELLTQGIVNILFGVISGLLKTKIEAPEIEFGGGKFGGGGASGKW